MRRRSCHIFHALTELVCWTAKVSPEASVFTFFYGVHGAISTPVSGTGVDGSWAFIIIELARRQGLRQKGQRRGIKSDGMWTKALPENRAREKVWCNPPKRENAVSSVWRVIGTCGVTICLETSAFPSYTKSWYTFPRKISSLLLQPHCSSTTSVWQKSTSASTTVASQEDLNDILLPGASRVLAFNLVVSSFCFWQANAVTCISDNQPVKIQTSIFPHFLELPQRRLSCLISQDKIANGYLEAIIIIFNSAAHIEDKQKEKVEEAKEEEEEEKQEEEKEEYYKEEYSNFFHLDDQNHENPNVRGSQLNPALLVPMVLGLFTRQTFDRAVGRKVGSFVGNRPNDRPTDKGSRWVFAGLFCPISCTCHVSVVLPD
ncbi:unnamed protein product [Soboliphyme baturini]|uniref:Uncharacterized protein n=1 Tax=Soboliphyme baturini TaxID=241478 RepID=A0A183IL14_9BILA|nr:unnamed protein product [Soboliphyme baturini]